MNELVTYRTDSFGVIHQLPPFQPVDYDESYLKPYTKYNFYGMSCLRLGNILNSVPMVSNVVDFGYGNGDFMRVCKNAEINISGYDISHHNVDGVPIITFEKLINGSWGMVTFFDSLEHVPDYSFLKNLNTSYIVISAPECHWKQDDGRFLSWKHRKPHEHLHHFNRDSCTSMMKDMGYKCIDISNVEDSIRGTLQGVPNIFTSIFIRI